MTKTIADVMTLAEAADYLRVSERTLWNSASRLGEFHSRRLEISTDSTPSRSGMASEPAGRKGRTDARHFTHYGTSTQRIGRCLSARRRSRSAGSVP